MKKFNPWRTPPRYERRNSPSGVITTAPSTGPHTVPRPPMMPFRAGWIANSVTENTRSGSIMYTYCV